MHGQEVVDAVKAEVPAEEDWEAELDEPLDIKDDDEAA